MTHDHGAPLTIRLRQPEGGYVPLPEDRGFLDLIAESCDAVGDTTNEIYRTFRLDELGGRWDVEREAALIRFTTPDGQVSTASYQFVGGWIEETGSFLWGWDHPQRTERNTARLAEVCAFGEDRGLPVLTTPYLLLSADDAWHVTKLAAWVIGWPGVYRARVNDTSWAYFAFDRPGWVQ